jgi:hypothetical protein
MADGNAKIWSGSGNIRVLRAPAMLESVSDRFGTLTPIFEEWWFGATGGPQTGQGTVSAASSVAGNATVGRVAQGAISAATTVSGNSVRGRFGTGAISAASTLSGSSVLGKAGDGAISSESTVAGNAARGAVADGTVAGQLTTSGDATAAAGGTAHAAQGAVSARFHVEGLLDIPTNARTTSGGGARTASAGGYRTFSGVAHVAQGAVSIAATVQADGVVPLPANVRTTSGGGARTTSAGGYRTYSTRPTIPAQGSVTVTTSVIGDAVVVVVDDPRTVLFTWVLAARGVSFQIAQEATAPDTWEIPGRSGLFGCERRGTTVHVPTRSLEWQSTALVN